MQEINGLQLKCLVQTSMLLTCFVDASSSIATFRIARIATLDGTNPSMKW